MLVDRSVSSRFALPQTSAEWEQIIARYLAVLAKVPLETWQFGARLLLVFILSVSLAKFVWLVMPTPKIPVAAVAIPVIANHTAGGGQSINIAQLKSAAVFGKSDAPAPKTEAPAIIENQAIDTHLNLVLVGIISSNEEKSSRAIIATSDKQDVYAIGDALPVGNGITLSKVMNDRVIINNNGQYESLWLYQTDPNAVPISQVAQAAPPPQATPVQTPRAWAPDHPTARGPQIVTPSGRGGSYGPPQNPDSAIAEATKTLSDVVAMSIYREGGQVIGYKIRPGRDAEKFRSLGLQNDDIVTAVNGMPLTNPAKIMEVYKNMGNTTSASLEIKRGGSVMTVDVVLQ